MYKMIRLLCEVKDATIKWMSCCDGIFLLTILVLHEMQWHFSLVSYRVIQSKMVLFFWRGVDIVIGFMFHE